MELHAVSTEAKEAGVVEVRRGRYSRKERSTPATATKTSLLDFNLGGKKLQGNLLKSFQQIKVF